MAKVTTVLTQNEKRILQLLMERTWPISVQEMVRLTKASKRTVYYSLNNLRYLFNQLEAGELRREKDGFLISEDQRKILQIYLTGEELQMDKKERISYIICASICADWQVRFKVLETKFGMSRNAVFADLTDAKRELADYHLELKSSKKAGYYVEGDMLLMRTVFQIHISRLLGSSAREQLDFFQPILVLSYSQKIAQINEELKLNLSETLQLELVYLMLMIHKRPSRTSMQAVDTKFLHETREWEVAGKVFQELEEYEKNYLAICLMNFNNGSTFVGKWSEDLELWDCAERLIDLFEIMACISFDRKAELLHSIYMHMKLSCYNYRNMVPHINPLYDEIVASYPDLYNMTKSCCERMQLDFPYLVDENEIAYLTMHFGVGMRYANKNASVAHVIITCPNITTSALLLRAEIEKQFENIVVEDVVRTSDINYYPFDRQIDFVISTVSFECRYPLVKVRSILTDEDKANIATLMMLLDINSNSDSVQLKILLSIVKRNVDDETYVRIRKDLNRYLNTEGVLVNVPTTRQKGLYDMLQGEAIRFVDEETDQWEDAIYKTSALLLQQRCVDPCYVEKMVEMGRIHGPYFVVNEDVAIAHARPQDGVHRLGLSLTVYREGLWIMKKKIRFLFVLATPDQQEHLHILENIMRLCNDVEMRTAILSAKDNGQVLKILSQIQ